MVRHYNTDEDGSGTRDLLTTDSGDSQSALFIMDKYDLSAVSSSKVLDATGIGGNSPQGYFFDYAGNFWYMVEGGNARVHEWSLSTNWAVGSASRTYRSFGVNQSGNVRGADIDIEGWKVVVQASDVLYEYKLPVRWRLETEGGDEADYTGISADLSGPTGDAFNFQWADKGNSFVVPHRRKDGYLTVSQWPVDEPFDISTQDGTYSTFTSNEDDKAAGAVINPDGTHLYVNTRRNGTLWEYAIDNFDITTASYTGASIGSAAWGLTMGGEGNVLIDSTNGLGQDVHQYK